jgi:hypothetical protein
MVVDDGALVEDNPAKPETLAITFSNFDSKKQTANLIGNLGSDEVLFMPGSEKMALVQITPTGNVTLTTITKPRRDGTSFAVHTRHMWLQGRGVISHMIGECRRR